MAKEKKPPMDMVERSKIPLFDHQLRRRKDPDDEAIDSIRRLEDAGVKRGKDGKIKFPKQKKIPQRIKEKLQGEPKSRKQKMKDAVDKIRSLDDIRKKEKRMK